MLLRASSSPQAAGGRLGDDRPSEEHEETLSLRQRRELAMQSRGSATRSADTSQKTGDGSVSGSTRGKKEGWLFKTGNGSMTKAQYKRRFCILNSGAFTYFKSAEDTKPKGHVPLSTQTQVGLTSHPKLQFTFEIRPAPGKRVFRLRANDEKERTEWVEVLAQVSGVTRFDLSGEVAGWESPVVEERKSVKDPKRSGSFKGMPTLLASRPSEGKISRMATMSPTSPGTGIRALVSKKKNRFAQDGYDLDLSYIGDDHRIIAMGFPSEGFEATYRNPLIKVQQFLKQYHPDHYKVYNLCSEKAYADDAFALQARYPFDDHDPPTMSMLIDVVKDVKQYLDEDKENVAVIHCKAGKGRTGTVIAGLLMQLDSDLDSDAALNMFGMFRTKNNKGVTIPSQHRYVRYLEVFNRTGGTLNLGNPPAVVIKSILLTQAPSFDLGGGCDPYFKVISLKDGKTVYNMQKDKSQKIVAWRTEPSWEVSRLMIPLVGDFRVVFYDQDTVGKDSKMFSIVLNSAFLRRSSYVFTKEMLDGAVKDTKNTIFPPSFTCEIRLGISTPDTDSSVDENNRAFLPVAVAKSSVLSDSSSDEEDTEEAPKKRGGGLSHIRGLVSKKKTRFQEQGFDLDLSYITPQVIAMGFPSTGTEAVFRNPLSDVQSFLLKFHNSKYKVYNLCSEKQYNDNTFQCQACFPHDDHNPPPFATLVKFCADARSFTDVSESHIIAVHCKAGKGRTGTAIASYLCMKECPSADAALNMFGHARTKNNKGVTIPSQHRYVHYYAAYYKNPFPLVPITRTLVGFVLTHPPNFDAGGGCDPYFKIYEAGNKKKIYDMRKTQKVVAWRKEHHRDLSCSVEIKGDIKIVFYDRDALGKDSKMFALWINTSFLHRSRYTFPKMCLDGAAKDKKCNLFDSKFYVDMLFEPWVGSDDTALSAIDENNTPFVPEEDDDESSDDDDEGEEEGYRSNQKARDGGGPNLNFIRGLVSKKKQRFQENGYDLDLSYVHPHLIAMGFPSTGLEGKYRNTMTDVKRFFTEYHDEHYKVYNLCSEREYKLDMFSKAVRFPMEDHNPPSFKMLVECVEDLANYLAIDTQNVAAVHCKAGKGRTGTVICSLMQRAGDTDKPASTSAAEALTEFGYARTRNGKGVTIPSQIRYVNYYGAYWRNYVLTKQPFSFEYPAISLTTIKMTHAPNFDVGGGCDPYFKCFRMDGSCFYNYKKQNKVKEWRKGLEFIISVDVLIQGDVHFVFYDEDLLGKDDKMFGFWLNTAFIRRSSYTIPKLALDKACKDIKHKLFNERFDITLVFQGVKKPETVEEVDANNLVYALPKQSYSDSVFQTDEEDEEDEED